MESLQGQLLIASSSLSDPNFARTVVLVAVHGDDGALGLILNRELGTPFQDVWSQVSKSPSARGERVRHGGPVRGTLMALHDHRSLANLVLAPDLYLATELSTMETLAATAGGNVRFYLGHAGWGAGQLERELDEGSWLLLPVTAGHVFGGLDPFELWKTTTHEAGRRELRSLVALKHLPEDPRVN